MAGSGEGGESAPYAFDTADIASVSAQLDAASVECATPTDVGLGFHELAGGAAVRGELLLELDFLFNYELDEDDSTPPKVTLGSDSYSAVGLPVRPFALASDEVHKLWVGLEGAVAHPLVRAHLSDVLLSSRLDTSQARAELTINKYLELAEIDHVDAFHRVLGMLRANTISRQRKLPIEKDIRSAMIDLAIQEMKGRQMPGITLRLLEAASQQPASSARVASETDRIYGALAVADTLYSDHFGVDAIATCRLLLAENEAQRYEARRLQALAYLKRSREADPPLKMSLAEETARLAKKYGVNDVHDEAIKVMQSVTFDDMDWHVSESEHSIPKGAIRAHLRRYKMAFGWRQAVDIFAAGAAPSGSHKRNKRTSASTSKNSLLSLISRKTFAVHGMPERTGRDFEAENLVKTEQYALAVYGSLLVYELKHIHARFGPIDEVRLKEHLMDGPVASAELSASVAHAIAQFWDGSYSDAARTAIPTIEAGARALLLLLDQAVYRVELGESPGRFPAMDFYIDKLEALGFDIDWARSVRTMLLSPGNNIRNLAAHGFRPNFSDVEAAVLIRLALLFARLGGERTDLQESLTEPTRNSRNRLRRRLGWVWAP